MVLDIPLITGIVFLFVFYIYCKIANHWQFLLIGGKDNKWQPPSNLTSQYPFNQTDQIPYSSGDLLYQQVFYSNCRNYGECPYNYNYLDTYINKLLILMTIDLITVVSKTAYALKTLYASWYNPEEERRNYNQYFIIAVCYYFSTLLKYILVVVAFRQGSEILKCRIAVIFLSTSATGVILYIPCIVVSLLVADKKRIKKETESYKRSTISSINNGRRSQSVSS